MPPKTRRSDTYRRTIVKPENDSGFLPSVLPRSVLENQKISAERLLEEKASTTTVAAKPILKKSAIVASTEATPVSKSLLQTSVAATPSKNGSTPQKSKKSKKKGADGRRRRDSSTSDDDDVSLEAFVSEAGGGAGICTSLLLADDDNAADVSASEFQQRQNRERRARQEQAMGAMSSDVFAKPFIMDGSDSQRSSRRPSVIAHPELLEQRRRHRQEEQWAKQLVADSGRPVVMVMDTTSERRLRSWQKRELVYQEKKTIPFSINCTFGLPRIRQGSRKELAEERQRQQHLDLLRRSSRRVGGKATLGDFVDSTNPTLVEDVDPNNSPSVGQGGSEQKQKKHARVLPPLAMTPDNLFMASHVGEGGNSSVGLLDGPPSATHLLYKQHARATSVPPPSLTPSFEELAVTEHTVGQMQPWTRHIDDYKKRQMEASQRRKQRRSDEDDDEDDDTDNARQRKGKKKKRNSVESSSSDSEDDATIRGAAASGGGSDSPTLVPHGAVSNGSGGVVLRGSNKVIQLTRAGKAPSPALIFEDKDPSSSDSDDPRGSEVQSVVSWTFRRGGAKNKQLQHRRPHKCKKDGMCRRCNEVQVGVFGFEHNWQVEQERRIQEARMKEALESNNALGDAQQQGSSNQAGQSQASRAKA